VVNNIHDHDEKGMYIINRKGRNFFEIAEDLANMMFDVVNMSRRERIALRYKCEEASLHFDWSNLGKYYDKAYNLVLER
jgi:glycogen(starch) synthase